MSNQQVNIDELQQELNTLKASYTDLEGRYNTLNSEYSQYKFDIEFNKDISNMKTHLNEDEMKALKTLKSSGEQKVYEMLLSNLNKANCQFGSGFNPVETKETQQQDNIDAFTKAIKERKGE